MASDVAAAMDALGITNADVFGVSQGGMIAQYLAIDRPDLVNKLVLAVTLSKNNPVVESTIEKWIVLTEQGNIKELVEDMAIRYFLFQCYRKNPVSMLRHKAAVPIRHQKRPNRQESTFLHFCLL